MRQQELLRDAGKLLAGGGLGLFVLPAELNLVVARGAGSHVWDVAGREYIDYLQTLGYLTRDVEELELEELPGAQGLRALRVRVDTSRGDVNTRASLAARPAAEPARAS